MWAPGASFASWQTVPGTLPNLGQQADSPWQLPGNSLATHDGGPRRLRAGSERRCHTPAGNMCQREEKGPVLAHRVRFFGSLSLQTVNVLSLGAAASCTGACKVELRPRMVGFLMRLRIRMKIRLRMPMRTRAMMRMSRGRIRMIIRRRIRTITMRKMTSKGYWDEDGDDGDGD